MMSGYVTGLLFVVLFIALGFIIQRSRGDNAKEIFDERQLLARFKAYKAGLFTLLIGILADALLKILGAAPYEDPLGEIVVLLIGVGVFAVQAIRHDAFMALNRNYGKQMVLYAVICITQLINAVSHWHSGDLVREGRLTLDCISLFCAALFLVIIVMLLIRSHNEQD